MHPSPGLVLAGIATTFADMETATVILEGDCQMVRLPRSIHLPKNIFVRQDGESVVLEPAKSKSWPEGFFDSIRISDPAFERPAQGQLPPVKYL
jgi:virulence-associated protein VagC